MIKTSAKKNVQLLVSHCLQQGMKQVVISPGSRNAPLIIAFNQHPDISCHVVPDERSAAFVALGMAQATQLPVGIICTSGSAPLNYYPAVGEAYYQRIPLVVMTADRPSAWINQGDGQTIVQENVFKNHINYFVQLEDNQTNDEYTWYMNRELSAAFNHAVGHSKGPIHINMALDEPLYDQVEVEELPIAPLFKLIKSKDSLSKQEKTHLASSWSKFSKKLVICGQLNPNDALKEELIKLSQDPSVLVLVENTSNLTHSSFIHCIDRFLNSLSNEELKDFKPDLLLSLGGAIVSKRIKTFLRTNQVTEHWRIGYDFPLMDTFQRLTHSFELDECAFFKELNQTITTDLNQRYSLKWKQKDYLIQEKQATFFASNQALSDITAFHLILDAVPENATLQMANSSVVRYCQLFDPIKSVCYRSNRGTSGIDGSTSTAVGSALMENHKWNVLITGDMSFFYDSNAFWNHLKTPNLKIFLINNGGGSIFKIIPGPDKTEELDEFFVFNNNFSAEALCRTFNITYFKAHNLPEIDEQLNQFYNDASKSSSLIEIFTQTIENEQELKKYFEFVKV
jgi:2-succinyl-5-enolpyruvyl-6-hydroxy-3-cyclohexene-1-carboxylate synthase